MPTFEIYDKFIQLQAQLNLQTDYMNRIKLTYIKVKGTQQNMSALVVQWSVQQAVIL